MSTERPAAAGSTERPAAAGSTERPAAAGVTEAAFDLDLAWRLHPQVSVRPERFGALLYHFGTRRLSFLKSTKLLAVVRSLEHEGSARSACAAAGVTPAELPSYAAALGTLAASSMICLGVAS